MADNTIDNQFLSGCYGAYWGCEAETVLDDENYNMCRPIDGVVMLRLLGGRYKCKMHLIPLASITDEDAIEVAKMRGLGFHEDPLYKLYIGRGIVAFHLENYTPYNGSKYDNSISRKHITNLHPRVFVQITDYLRSKGYDCGYGHIPSLIEAGIAIDKTTLKN